MAHSPSWIPSDSRIASSTLTKFATRLGFEPSDYTQLHQWSVHQQKKFWSEVWNFGGVIGERGQHTLEHEIDFINSKWFSDSKLNFAQNLLRRIDESPAIVSYLESGKHKTISFADLQTRVGQFATELTERGIKQGDRVVGFLPNVAETVISMLGTASIGAIWSSCSPDFGLQAALDRFGQISPKLLIGVDGYHYNDKEFNVKDTVHQLAQQLSSVEDTIQLNLLADFDDDFDAIWKKAKVKPTFASLPFNHPLYVMYSSGTTGRPKCIVHGAGGTLLKHLVEHQFHVDLEANSRMLFFTTCGWMMWNWLVSALASGTTIYLYEGSPFYPESDRLLKLIETEQLTVFGAGAKYYSSLEKARVNTINSVDTSTLQSFQSTGSPLAPESFDYIYSNLKHDVQVASITGGTDLIGCFGMGIPWLPVYRGEIQGPVLGMDVDVFDSSGNSIRDKKGELVCKRSFPSKPIGFWNDVDDEKYRSAYFDMYPNLWAHGDFAEIRSDTSGLIVHGRSDAVLNPGGVRIGTAEIYRQVESMDEIVEALCIGQPWQDDTRVVLFVVLAEDLGLDEELIQKIKQRIRRYASPRHVPSVVLQVTDIPRTRSGKIAELSVRAVVQGEEVTNTSALSNPESLEQYQNRNELQAPTP